ncbi:MAG: hypothetical protein KF685_03160 [Acidobacteria bacterium]|nr:hypothetical protein [Acidobacteriota bacterium]
MKLIEMPPRWQECVKKYLETQDHQYDQISLADFKGHTKIVFDDDSFAYFRYSFYLIDAERNELGVFTEHCGYHIFPLYNVTIEIYDLYDNRVRSEKFEIE